MGEERNIVKRVTWNGKTGKFKAIWRNKEKD